MPPFLLEFLFATFTAVCGLAGGWYACSQLLPRSSAPLPEPSAAPPPPEPAKPKQEAKASREVLGRLQEMAVRMAADVGQHNTRVQEINAELAAADAQNPESVVAVVAKIFEANERMQEQLSQAEQRLREQALQIESHVAEARTDALTGIANRRAFDDQMERCLADHFTRGRPFSVMMIDIDNFKKFNDTHGHLAGDHVLKCVARIIKQQVSKLELVARYGGEEFAIVFPDSNMAAARPIAERARAAIAAAKIHFDNQELRVAASGGIAEMLAGEDAPTLVKRADAALYDSKNAGRNCGHWHDGTVSHMIASDTPLATAAEVPALPLPSLLEDVPAGDERCDELTGISSRGPYFDDVLRRVAERKRGGAPVSAMLVRIDRFAELSAELGPSSVNLVLKAVTQFLKATMREMDHVARYDDDVFGLLLPGAELTDASEVADRLRRSIEQCRLKLKEGECQFTVSIGLAEASRSDGGEKLLELVNAALDAAGGAGGNRAFVYTGLRFEPVSEEMLASA